MTRARRARPEFAMPRRNAQLAIAVLGLWLLPLAAGHGPPATRAGEVRILVDQNDDCSGDDGTAAAECNGTHDLVAMDLREAWDEAFAAQVVVFRFLLNGGAPADGFVDVLTFRTGQGVRSFELRTTDNLHFTGTFDRVNATGPIGDGARFAVEGTVRLSTLGAIPGDVISEFQVQAFHGTTAGDVMPGTYSTEDGRGPVGSAEMASPTELARPSYRLVGSHAPGTSASPTPQGDDPGAPGVSLGAVALALALVALALRRR